MEKIKFNINDYVYVQLTSYGREVLEKEFYSFWTYIYGKDNIPFSYIEPMEDENGWSKFQLWDLMSKLGDKIHMGSELLFKTEILFERHE